MSYPNQTSVYWYKFVIFSYKAFYLLPKNFQSGTLQCKGSQIFYFPKLQWVTEYIKLLHHESLIYKIYKAWEKNQN